jgi:hypothetical protein
MGYGLFEENASQLREQTSLFRRARQLLHPNISAKFIRNDQSIGRKQERTVVKITSHVPRQNKWTRTVNPVQVLAFRKDVLFVRCSCDILASSNGYIVLDYNDSQLVILVGNTCGQVEGNFTACRKQRN